MKNKIKRFICTMFGHDDKYRYQVVTDDKKILEVTTCARCWREINKEVK